MPCILSSPIQAVALHLGSGFLQPLSTRKPQEEVASLAGGVIPPHHLSWPGLHPGSQHPGSAGGGMLVLWRFALASALALSPSQDLGESS